MRRDLRGFLLLLALAAAPVAAGDGDLDVDGFHPPQGALAWNLGPAQAGGGVAAPDGAAVWVGRVDPDVGDPRFHWRSVPPDAPGVPCSFDPAGATASVWSAATFDAEGRLVLVGTATYPGLGQVIAVARYLYPACTLDVSFDGDGYFTYDLPTSVTGVAIATTWAQINPPFPPVERLVVAGHVQLDFPDLADLVVLRLRENGTLDTGFGGGDGFVQHDLANQSNFLFDLVVDEEDRLLLAGSVDLFGDDPDAMLVRLAPDGALDPEFGALGWRRFELSLSGSGEDLLEAVAIAADGRIFASGSSIVAGSTGAVLATVAVSADGDDVGPHLNISYGAGVLLSIHDSVLQGNGRLIIVGSCDFDDGDREIVAARLDVTSAPPFLSFDAGFGDDDLGDPLTYYEDLQELAGGDENAAGVALSGGRPLVFFTAESASSVLGGVARLDNAYIFADGFESGSTSRWAGW